MTNFSHSPPPSPPFSRQHIEVSRSQLENVIKSKVGGNLMYFISYLTDVLSMTNFFPLPLTFNSAKL